MLDFEPASWKEVVFQLILWSVVFWGFNSVLACPKGTMEYQGLCADVPVPADNVAVPEAKPSDEKPRRDPTPEWIDGNVHADLTGKVAAKTEAPAKIDDMGGTLPNGGVPQR
jgi:hypothetical protein